MIQTVSIQTLQRLPSYLHYLKTLSMDKERHVSAKAIAEALGLGEVQVRKDLASVSSKGRPKTGYQCSELIRDIESYLGYGNENDAILVGAGRLGKALMAYEGFHEYGLNIVAAFDADDEVVGEDKSGRIYPLSKLKDLCERMGIRIGIITVPARCAQSVCDLLVEAGILAVWNFAPTHLNTPPMIMVKSENMAASLALLSRHLAEEIGD